MARHALADVVGKNRVSLIEQAAQRLEQLRNAGIDVADLGTRPAPAERAPPPEALLRELEARAGLGEQSAEAAPPVAKRESRRVTIDLAKIAKSGIITPDAPRSQLADEFRVIKRPLLANALGKSAIRVERGNMIMITSAFPGEGKTFTAANLAMSIAMELDSRVLLVDGDVANPALLPLLGLRETNGLMDVLVNPGVQLADVLLRTNVERLSILPAGRHHRRATEVLSSEAMARLIEEMASRYPDRIVLWDAPPLLPTTESRVLAGYMGQVVVVVEADRTTHHAVKSALALLEECPVVMTMLNKARRTDVGSYYGYYGNNPDA
jgi:receptor protein-tyrosine kinase